VDVIVTRGLRYAPIVVLGFSETALMVYVLIVAAQATFIHANVRWELHLLRRVIATPAFHHWHHANEPEAIDKNFAVHTPVWDRLFGTYYLPDPASRQYASMNSMTSTRPAIEAITPDLIDAPPRLAPIMCSSTCSRSAAARPSGT